MNRPKRVTCSKKRGVWLRQNL